MSFLDLATISFHRRNEMETRINTFVGKCDLATNNIQKLKERVKGFVDHLNCEQSELKDRFLNCMQRLEEYTYLITDFNIACEQFEATSGTETEPVHDNLNSPAPLASPNPNPNLIDILSETVQTTMTVCTAQCPTKVFNHVKVPKDQQKLIQFSSTSCSSESVPDVKVEKTVECNENTIPVAANETTTGDVMDVSSVTTTGDVTVAVNETTSDDVTGAAAINDDIALATKETVTTEENSQGRGRRRKRTKVLTNPETSEGANVHTNAAKVPKFLNTSFTETSRNESLHMQKRENYTYDNQLSKSSRESKSDSDEYGDSDTIVTEEHSEDLLSTEFYSLTAKEEKLDGNRFKLIHRGLSETSARISNDEDYNRRLKSLEEKSNTALKLLDSTILVGMKEIKQLLALNNNNCNKTNKKNAQRLKDALPLETKEAIGDFEKLLSEEKYYREFSLLIHRIGGSNGRDFTERIFSTIFSRLFAKNNTWEGKLSKYPVKDLAIVNIIEETILTKFPSWTSADFEKVAEGPICRQYESHNLPVQPMLRTDIQYDATVMNIDGGTFWMLVGDPNELYRLMTQMTLHYQRDEGRVQLSPAEVASLTYCAYYDHDETASYYRALFVKFVDNGWAEVFLVDTGECRTTEICYLQPLAAQFCDQPPYVYCCHLTAVDMFFSNDPKLALRQEAVLNEFIGKQCFIQVDENNSESLGIWVTNPGQISLNDFMVQEKLAVYIDKEMATGHQSARARPQAVAQSDAKSDSDSFTVVLGPPGLVHRPASGPAQTPSPVAGHSPAGPSGAAPRSPPVLNHGGPSEPSRAGRPAARQGPLPELSRDAFRFNQSAPGLSQGASGLSQGASGPSQGASGPSQGASGPSQGPSGPSQGASGPSQGACALSRNVEELDLAQCPEHDDPVEAVTGYHNRDEADICKFYKGGPEKTCYKKSRCKKKHVMIHPDGWTLDRVGVPARVRSLPLPAPGTWRRVRVTHVCHLDRLYVQYVADEPEEVVKPFGVVLPPATLAELVRDMNSPAMRMTYKPLKLSPALGELVAALYPFDDQWYRARVLSLSRADQNIEVCYIDYGNVVWVKEDEVRALEPRHWRLPAQAQRCRLAGVRARGQHSRRWAAARDRLAALALEKVFDMRIIARDYEEVTVEMFDEHGASLAEQLAGSADADVALEPYELEPDAQLTHKLVVP